MTPSRRGFLGLLAAAPIAAPAAAREMAKPALANGGWIHGEVLPLFGETLTGSAQSIGTLGLEIDTSSLRTAVTAEIERIKDAARVLNLPTASGAPTEAADMPNCTPATCANGKCRATNQCVDRQTVSSRLRAAIHLESAAIAPQTTALIEAAKEAANLLERLG